MQPYAPRPIWFVEVVSYEGWRIKCYRIRHNDADFNADRFEHGTASALADLPTPAVNTLRAGVGFLIEHQGNGVDYVVLGWWDRENEMPLKIWVREHAADASWRRAAGAESVCVWDLQVIWHEREAYVATVLNGTDAKGAETYLAYPF